MNYTTTTIFLHKTIMVTQLQDIFCKIARSGEKMSLSTFICRNEECRKGFTNDTSWKKVRFFMHYCIFSCRLSPCLSLDAVYCMPVCLSVCLSVCLCAFLCRGQFLRTFDIRYSESSLVQVLQKVFNIFNDLDPLYAFYFSQWFILFLEVHYFFLFQGKSSAHKKESCYSGS